MVDSTRGVVSDPAAPFGGVSQSGVGREGAHEGHARVSRRNTSRSTGKGNAMDVIMPQLGETVEEGTVAVGHKKKGDR